MNKEFVPYEESLAMKELGFDEPCVARYFKNARNKDNPEGFVMNTLGDWYKHNSGEISKSYLSAPLWQQAFLWFREKYEIHGHLESSPEQKWFYVIEDISKATGYTRKDGTERQMPRQLVVCDNLPSYEEAQLACLQELIKIVKDGK